MKEFILRLFTFISALFVTSSIFTGFDINDLYTYIFLAALFSVLQLLLKPSIKFFTIPHNKFTVFIANIIIMMLIFYSFEMFFPGIVISDGGIGPFISTSIVVPLIEMKSFIVIIFASTLISTLNTIVTWTFSKE